MHCEYSTWVADSLTKYDSSPISALTLEIPSQKSKLDIWILKQREILISLTVSKEDKRDRDSRVPLIDLKRVFSLAGVKCKEAFPLPLLLFVLSWWLCWNVKHFQCK